MSYPINDSDGAIMGTANEGGGEFDIKKFLYKLVGFLPWIIISVLVAYTVAQLYLRYTPKMHRIDANLLIKDDAASSPDYNLLMELGITPDERAVQNQIDILQSYELAGAVTDSLNLQITIFTQGRIASSALYGKNAPVFIHIVKEDTGQFQPVSYQLFLYDTRFALVKGEERSEHGYKDTFLLGNRMVYFERNAKIKADPNGYAVAIKRKHDVAKALSQSITVTKVHDNGGILNIAMLNESPDRAIDIINKLIEIFNTAGIKDKNIARYKATKFVGDRVDTVSEELDDLELRAEAFKRANKITDIDAAGSNYLTETQNFDNQQAEQTGQMQMLDAFEKFISEAKGYTDIIPSQYSITEPTLTALIGKYNEQVQTYQEQAKISTDKDPVFDRLKNQISDTKANILKNIQSIRDAYQLKLNQIKSRGNSFENLLVTFPGKRERVPEIEKTNRR